MELTIATAKSTLRSVWTFVGCSDDECDAQIAELDSRIERLLADAVRQAESAERRLAMDAKRAFDSVLQMSSQMKIEIDDPVVRALSHYVAADTSREGSVALDESCQRPSCSLSWPFSRPLDLGVVHIFDGRSLRTVVGLLRQAQQKMSTQLDLHIQNRMVLEKITNCLELPVHDRSEARDHVIDWCIAQTAYWNAPRVSCDELSRDTGVLRLCCSPPTRKRERDPSNSIATPNRIEQPFGGKDDAALLRVTSRQDLSRSAIQALATALLQKIEHINGEVIQLVEEQRKDVASLHDKVALSAAGGIVTDGPQSSERPSEKCGSSPLSVDYLFDEVRAVLLAPMRCEELREVMQTKSRLQKELFQRSKDRLQEETVLLSEVYASYYRITGDPSFADAPNYSEWLTDKDVPSAADDELHNTHQAPHTIHLHRDILELVSDVESAQARATEERFEMTKRVAFLKDNVMPLIAKRRSILARKDALQHAARDRLFNKKGNMARVLLEEETLRREVSKTLPKLMQRLSDLLAEWGATFPSSRLLIDGQPLETLIAADAPQRDVKHRGAASLSASRANSLDKENTCTSKASNQTVRTPLSATKRKPAAPLTPRGRSATPPPRPVVQQMH